MRLLQILSDKSHESYSSTVANKKYSQGKGSVIDNLSILSLPTTT